MSDHEFEPDEDLADDGPGVLRYWLEATPGLVWVAVVGGLAGLVVVGVVWVSGQGCELARDAPNCGVLGLPLLVLAVAAAVFAAHQLLRRLAVPRSGLTAFLGVCFMGVVLLAFLADRLRTAWSLLVVPVVTAGTFVLAHLLAGRIGGSDG